MESRRRRPQEKAPRRLYGSGEVWTRRGAEAAAARKTDMRAWSAVFVAIFVFLGVGPLALASDDEPKPLPDVWAEIKIDIGMMNLPFGQIPNTSIHLASADGTYNDSITLNLSPDPRRVQR